MTATPTPQAPRRRTLKALLGQRVVEGGDSGWWRALIPALAIMAVLLAALELRATTEQAGAAVDRAAEGREMAAGVDRLAQIARARMAGDRDVEVRELTTARSNVLAQTARVARDDDDSGSAADAVATQATETDSALAAAVASDSSRAAKRRAAASLAVLQPSARSVSDRLDSAADSADDRAGRQLTWTLIGVLVLVSLLLGSFWSRRNAADAQRRERRFHALLRNSSDLVLVVDPSTLTIRYATPVVERMLGYPPDAVVGSSLNELTHPEDRGVLADAVRAVSSGDDGHETDRWRALHHKGGCVDVEASWLNLSDDPSVQGLVVTIRDVGERTNLEDQLRHQAFHDPLTGLPNRSLFEDRVRHSVARTRRHGRGMAVLFVDLDDFKTVNDSLGHAAGDELLRQVAQRLNSWVRTSDTVARLGGDEFAVLVEEPEHPEEAQVIAQRINTGMEQPCVIDGHELFVGASVGIAPSESGSTSEELMRNADTAMYAAKAGGKGRSAVFQPTMHMEVQRRLMLSGDLRRALDNGELFVEYQPLVDLSSGRILGAEALARWNHPNLGRVAPGDFIPVAEETGLIVPLGGWVLMQACQQAADWHARSDQDPIYVSVNVSPRQFRQSGTVVEQVRAATSASGIEPSLLVLEITESVLMQDRESVRGELAALQELGVRVAIDDFGTGYSALTYLRDFPIDMVKMDQSFVNDLSAGRGDQALVRSVVELGEALDMEIVAEGIERQDQLDHLSEMRCSIGQGYYFARPLDGKDMGDLLDGSLTPTPPARQAP